MAIHWPQLTQFIFVALALVLAGLTLALPKSRWLGAFFIVIGIHGAFSRLPFAAGTVLDEYSYTLAFAYGPLLFFALSQLLRDQPARPSRYLLIAVPVLVAALLIATGQPQAWLGILLTGVQLVSVAAGFRELRWYESIVEQVRSSGAVPAIRWVRSALGLYTLFILLLALRSVLAAFLSAAYMVAINQMVAVAIVLTLALLTYRILREPGWIPRATTEEQAAVVVAAPEPPTELQLQQAAELETHLKEQRSFLDPELSLGKLAGQLDWSPRDLSAVINRVDNQSFSQKINQLRVAEAKTLLADASGRAESLLEIALASGFNSKSAFNLMFKRFVGQTPSEYRKNLPE